MDTARTPTYTDSTEVKEGDKIRYRQAPGGLLPASPEWTYGVATTYPRSEGERERMEAFNRSQGYIALDPDELVLCADESYGKGKVYYNIYSHIIERA